MSLFVKFKQCIADIIDDISEEQSESTSELESEKEFIEKREKSTRKDILKDIEGCFLLLNYIKKSDTLHSLSNDCESIENLLNSITYKLESVSKDSKELDTVINKLKGLLKKLINESDVNVSDIINRLLVELNSDDILYKFFALNEYLQNSDISKGEDITLVKEFNILYIDFIRFLRSIIENSNRDTEKILDEILSYSKNLDIQIISKLNNQTDFENYKNNFQNNNSLYDYLGRIFKLTKETGSKFEVNLDIVSEISLSLYELKNAVLKTFKQVTSKEDVNDSKTIELFYKDLLDTISSKEFFKKYKMTTDSLGDNQAVRQFLLETIYNNFSLGNMSKYCDKNVNSILTNLKDYLSQFKLRDSLPADYQNKVKDIVNFGVLSIALTGTDRFINSKDNSFDILNALNYYTKSSITKSDLRENVVKPLNSLYKGIIKLIYPAIVCKPELKNIPNKDITSSQSENVVYVFDTEESLNFLEEVYNSLNMQLKILNDIPDVSKEDSIIEDSEILDVRTTIIKLYEFFNKKFFNDYKKKFDEYNTYIGNL